MAISFTNIQSGIVQTINTLIGKDAPVPLFTSPVIKSNFKGTVPPYPVVVVGKLGSGMYGISSVSAEYVNDDLTVTREVRYKGVFQISVHTTVEDDAMMVAQVIRDTLFTPEGIGLLNTNCNCGLLSISSPTQSYRYLSTDYEEIAQMNIEMSITDSTTSTDVIETIVIDGELYDLNGNIIETVQGNAP